MGQSEIQLVLAEQERTIQRLSAMQRVDDAQSAQVDALREQLSALFAVLEDRLSEIEKRLGIVSQGRFTDYPF